MKKSASGRASTLASNMLATAVGNAVTPAAALISMPILAYNLGVTGRGEVAAATAPLMLAITAATFGLPEAVTYFTARNPRVMAAAATRAGAWITGAGVVSMAICFVASDLLAGGDPGIERLILVAILSVIPTLLVLVLHACAAAVQSFDLVAWDQGIVAVGRLVAISALAIFGALTPLTATIVISTTPLLGGLAYLKLGSRYRRADRGEQPVEPTGSRQLLQYGSRVWLGSLSGVLLARLDQAIMTPLSNAFQLGLYAVAVNVSDVALIIHSAIRDVTFAAESARRDDARLCASARISTAISLALCCALGIGIPIGLPLLFGADFRAAIPAAFGLLVAVIAVIPGAIAGVGLSARGRPGLRSAALFAAVVANVGSLVLLVPHFGAFGASLATVLGNLVFSQMCIVWYCRLSGVRAREFYGLRSSDISIIRAKMRRVMTRSAS